MPDNEMKENTGGNKSISTSGYWSDYAKVMYEITGRQKIIFICRIRKTHVKFLGRIMSEESSANLTLTEHGRQEKWEKALVHQPYDHVWMTDWTGMEGLETEQKILSLETLWVGSCGHIKILGKSDLFNPENIQE